MTTFIDLMKSSVLTQAAITLILIIIMGIMLILQYPVPAELYTAIGLAMGFFFGGKMGIAQGKLTSNIEKTEGEKWQNTEF